MNVHQHSCMLSDGNERSLCGSWSKDGSKTDIEASRPHVAKVAAVRLTSFGSALGWSLR